ncbi:hypothetical protein SUGI_0808480 [Cryptomeria japonica]|nr:hypothetical protein SUGI_0808480 [Cryptomeria japonica]
MLLSSIRSQYPSLNGMPLNAAIVTRKYHQFGSFHVLPGLRLACIENHVSTKKKISFKVKSKICAALNAAEYRRMKSESQGTLVDNEDDTDLCPVDCVKEFRNDAELNEILEAAKETDSLVVVDFYRTACGSCKYIEQGFMKLCKGAGDKEASVIFLKHNVMDEYEEQSEVAERLKIKVVPLFHFYKDGILVDAFPTRDKKKLIDTIRKYASRSIELTEE